MSEPITLSRDDLAFLRKADSAPVHFYPRGCGGDIPPGEIHFRAEKVHNGRSAPDGSTLREQRLIRLDGARVISYDGNSEGKGHYVCTAGGPTGHTATFYKFLKPGDKLTGIWELGNANNRDRGKHIVTDNFYVEVARNGKFHTFFLDSRVCHLDEEFPFRMFTESI